jgi:hypothetical protein
VHTGRSFPVTSWPGVQIALTPHGLGRHKSSGTNFLHDTNGSPVMSRGQEHTGVNPRKLQSAFTPQDPKGK